MNIINMQKIIVILIALSLLLNLSLKSYSWAKNKSGGADDENQRVKEDKWIGWDKLGHFFISGFIAGSSYSIYHKSFSNDRKSSVYFASILTLGLGMGKELSDMKKPSRKFSCKDLLYDILGISVGILIATQ